MRSRAVSDLSLYEQVLGANYAQLPLAVQRFHRLGGRVVLQGGVETDAPSSALARVLAYCLGTPRAASSGPLRFELDAGPALECWTRHFPAQTMTSRLRVVNGQIEEQLGAARLTFDLAIADGALKMVLSRMRFLGIRCPRWLMPQIVAEESGDADQLHFNIVAALPLVGVVASYRGQLQCSEKVMS